MSTLRPSTKPTRWSLADALDLPVALEEERFSPDREKELAAARADAARDLQDAAVRAGGEVAVLRAWLQRRRARMGETTPGTWIEEVLRNAGWIAGIAGLLLGLGAASNQLFFTGPEPLNVFFLLGVFVLLPVALSATMLLTLALRPPGKGNFVQRGFLFLARKLTRFKAHASPTAAQQLRADASWATVTKSLGRDSRLLEAPVIGISQKFALGFGLGLLAMLQIRVSFWELAFGWQTTLTAPGEFWHLVTQAIAAPWSWFWPEGSPTLEQINATRYSRLDGAAPVDAAASRAWWPFLAAAILVWSVLLRGLVLWWLGVLQRRRLRAFDPLVPDARLLLRRLSPGWSISAPAAAPAEAEEPLRPRDPAASVGAGAWFALMPEEADQTIPPREELEQFLGAGIQREAAFEFDDSMGERTIAALAEIRDHEAPVAILLPTTRDPIDEVCDTLKGIEEAVGTRTSLIVLRGTPERLALWKHKLGIWGIGLPVEYIALP